MAKCNFAERLYVNGEEIRAQFRVHQSTILQLATKYKVGQETMRQFLIFTMDDYREVVIELRSNLRIQNSQSILSSSLSGQRVEMSTGVLTRTMSDFSPEEIKEFQRRIEARAVRPQVSYHPYVVRPLMGDI